MSRPPHLPPSVDVTKLEVGGNLAVTPGSVVLRTDVFELIQYQPATQEVHEVPLVFIPPTINEYYILEISPGRSMVEWLLGEQLAKSSTEFLRIPVRRARGTLLPTLGDDYA